MELLPGLGIIGSEIGVFGDEKGILTMIVGHKNEVEYHYRIQKEGNF